MHISRIWIGFLHAVQHAHDLCNVIDYGFSNNKLTLIVSFYQCFSYTCDQSMGCA